MNYSTDQQHIEAALNRAGGMLRSGATIEALDLLARLDRQFPVNAEIMRTRGIVLARLGKHEEAEHLLRAVFELRPAERTAASDYANVLLIMGRSDQALATLRRYLQSSGDGHVTSQFTDVGNTADEAVFLFNLGRAYKMCGQAEQAVAPLEKTLRLNADNYGALVTLGDTYKALGRTEDAARQYRQAIKIQPGDGTAWWSLSNLKSGRFTEDELTQLEQQAGKARSAEQKVFFSFAMGSAFEQRNQVEDAFSHYAHGNQLKQQESAWNRQAFERWVKAVDNTLSEVEIAPRAEVFEQPRPIFIVSLPRSGSTLTEQILAAHSNVTAASELPWLPQLAADVSRQRGQGAHQWAGELTSEEWQELGAAYLRKCAAWHRHTPVFTDKLPGNIPYTGLILAMLPNALVVHVKRKPMDVCWSCYRQLFISGSEFAYDLQDLAAYWETTSRLMDRWQKRAPGRVLQLNYEDLVQDPENQTRNLLQFAGLEFEPTCLQPHRARRAVNTASAAQVREAIHTRGLDHWKRYQKHLGPLIEALGDAAGV